ncbi:MAG TPA: NAD(P)/FAD-dependent oxidoreductase [Phycisphaerales bacterium]|nr:NAD(P)/FAD-dependent oxidoreductase [Phycisphaerales bacterium]
MHDAIVIGGGPAGLSAALVLARARRDVLLIDSNLGRNRRASEIHGFLTRDCTAPADFLREARRDVERYGVRVDQGEAVHAERSADGAFTVRYRALEPGGAERSSRSRKLLLATGMRDCLPAIEGVEAFYGVSVHHCPYCDGYEHRDKRLVAYGHGDRAVGLALSLRTWSPHVTACTDGGPVRDELAARALTMKIPIRSERVRALSGEGAALQEVRFESGRPLACDALFFNTGQVQRSDLPRLLGCSFKEDGGVKTSSRQCAGVPGLFVAGDADRDVEFVIVAAAEGATAAVAINAELQREETGG